MKQKGLGRGLDAIFGTEKVAVKTAPMSRMDLLIAGVFTAFTFYTPHIPLFRDPVTGTYGFVGAH